MRSGGGERGCARFAWWAVYRVCDNRGVPKMKRLLSVGLLLLLAVASIVLAQSSDQGTLRTSAGDTHFSYVAQSGQTYVSAGDVVSGLGGTITPDANGYKVTLGNTVAA